MANTITSIKQSSFDGETAGATILKDNSGNAKVTALPYDTDFDLTKDGAKECVIANMKAPIDVPESIRFAIEDIANVYAGSDLDPHLYAPLKKGKSVVVGIKDAFKVQRVIADDSTGAISSLLSETVYPVAAHAVFKFPISTEINAEDVQKVLYRLIAALYKTASDATRLNELMRGSLNPM